MIQLTPSNAELWSSCPAWATMADKYPRTGPKTQEQLEALAVSKMAAAGLRGWSIDTKDNPVTLPAKAGEVWEGVTITRDMVSCARIYCNDVIAVVTERPGGELKIAETVDCSSLGKGISPGVPDALYTTDSRSFIWDLRWTATPIFAKRNKQALCCLPVASYDNEKAQVRIVQPRRYDGGPVVDVWTIEAAMLAREKQLITASIKHALAKTPPAHASLACNRCPGAHACETKLNQSLEVIAALDVREPNPRELAAEISWLREAKIAVETRLKGLEAVALANSSYLPGYTKGTGRSNTHWSVDNERLRETGVLFGLDFFNEAKPRTPKQMIAEGVPKELIDTMSKITPGKPKLIENDAEEARRMFCDD